MIGFLIDILLCVLLGTVIIYAAILNRRLGHLRAQEADIQGLVAHLLEATDAAETAITKLKDFSGQEGLGLASNLQRAGELTERLEAQLVDARAIEERLDQLGLGLSANGDVAHMSAATVSSAAALKMAANRFSSGS